MEIRLTPLERERYDSIRACIGKDLTNAEVAARLGITVRQTQRLKRAVEKHGEEGIRHGSRGRVSNHATHPETASAAIAYVNEEKHRDFGPTFAQEQLAKRGVVLGVETLRTLMIKKNLWKPKTRRGPAIHREWRDRMGSEGELVQFDGSYHDWFENGAEECLLAAIDDATSRIVHAVFEDNEGVHAVFRFWRAYMEQYGRPVAIYLDKFSTYKVNHKNAVDNAEMMTQFERAMKELEVRVICANSPEAKGRIERLFGTLQDRMVKEMRLAGVSTRDNANTFACNEYLPDHNKRFSVPAKHPHDAHRPLSADLRMKLSAIFSIQSKRKVNNDYTIQWKTRWFQLEAVQKTSVYKRDEIIVEERSDSTIHIRLKNIYLNYRELPGRPKSVRVPVAALTRQKPDWHPPKDHPWRKFNF